MCANVSSVGAKTEDLVRAWSGIEGMPLGRAALANIADKLDALDGDMDGVVMIDMGGDNSALRKTVEETVLAYSKIVRFGNVSSVATQLCNELWKEKDGAIASAFWKSSSVYTS